MNTQPRLEPPGPHPLVTYPRTLGSGRGVWRRALERAPERAPERERGRVLPYVLSVPFV